MPGQTIGALALKMRQHRRMKGKFEPGSQEQLGQDVTKSELPASSPLSASDEIIYPARGAQSIAELRRLTRTLGDEL